MLTANIRDIATWVCIAEHQSSFDTAAVGRHNGDGSINYGLFQISDRYWCSDVAPQEKACRLPCTKLMDGDLTDDAACIRTIYEEHMRISGDGFNAWAVYPTRCQNQNIDHIRQCFDSEVLEKVNDLETSASKWQGESVKKGKVYNKCELAQELYHKHRMPMEQIPTWVCIAQHESSFNTAAVGRLNTDGSADHGLFQISDLYWCSHDKYGGKACNIPCDRLLDSDISDDVRCIKIIHEEHTRISGDGFNAWTVYKPHCRNQGLEKVKQCFSEKELKESQSKSESSYSSSSNALIPTSLGATKKGKVYNKCELAQELYHKHKMPMDQIPTWVCIAQHESSFNTAAVGRLNTDGSADHGLFQISDLYWCSHDQYGGKACNIPCDRLLDSDISDDVRCIKIIYEEHTRISGDGFNAWTVYKPHCRNQGLEKVKQCFSEKELKSGTSSSSNNALIPSTLGPTKKGKVYNKCELAQELYHKHGMPMDQIPTWVCIAQHESSFNTAAVGRLNTDGSADHGLFQISDLYWCSHDQYGGKACNIPCDRLLDSDISDDVRCIKIIHDEHTRISGDGFNAWTVYKPHCRNQGLEKVKQCFSEKELKESQTKSQTSSSGSNALVPQNSGTTKKGKIYKKCELAQELYHKHRMPMEQIPTWVCIAQHESSFNTAAVGRLNTDGSADHGLFQISDLYWCSHDQYGGKVCNIPCHKLLDSDITDDVRCIKIIYDEHTQISGDGFNAWTVYKPHCRNRKMDDIRTCFSDNEIQLYEENRVVAKYQPPTSNLVTKKPGDYKHNPFLNNIPIAVKPLTSHETSLPAGNKDSSGTHSYKTNPFLNNIPIAVKPLTSHETSLPAGNKDSSGTQSYQTNPFLSGAIKTSTASQQIQSSDKIQYLSKETESSTNYQHNPFLSGAIKTSPTTAESTTRKSPLETTTSKPLQQSYKENPFLAGVKPQITNQNSAEKLSLSSKYVDSNNFRHKPDSQQQSQQGNLSQKPFQSISYPSDQTSKYVDSNNFRNKVDSITGKPLTPATSKPKTTATKSTTTTRKPTTATTKSTTTTRKPLATTTTRSTTTRKPTTATSKSTTTTRKPLTTTTTRTTTTRSSKPSTTWSWSTTSTKKPLTTTTARSTTTRKPTTATTKSTTTSRPLTSTTTRSKTTLSSKPSTTWSWTTTTTRKPNSAATKPTTKSTTTTRKPLTSTTTRSATNRSTTSSTTAWNWSTATTKKPTTKPLTTTTRKPQTTTTTSKKPNTTLRTTKITTTTKPAKSTTTKSSTSWSWNSSKWKDTTPTQHSKTTTTKQPSTTTRSTKTTSWNSTTKKPITTTTKPTLASNNGQYKASTTTTKRPPQTTTAKTTSTTWSWDKVKLKETTKPNKAASSWSWSSTTSKPINTTKTTISWNKSKEYTQSSKITNTWSNNKQSQVSSTTKSPATTTKRPSSSTTKSLTKWISTTTKRPSSTTTKSSTNWNSYNWQSNKVTTTTIRLSTTTTKAQTTTTKNPTKNTGNWQQQKYSTNSTTKSPLSAKTTKSPTNQWNWQQQQAKYSNATTTTQKPIPTSSPLNTKQQTTWQHWQNGNSKTTSKPQTNWQSTTKPQTTTYSWQHNKPMATTTRPSKNNDPFSDPFFERFRQGVTITTTKRPTVPPHIKESKLYQDYKNITSDTNKPIVTYNYQQAGIKNEATTTTKRPQKRWQ
ncbi:uncharacterized protein isoform X2 [Musca autumnalis]|uniref:uncharacterized protein isoform X2 n=1 Tax=Musca autumnalis TaxID=221902 RepID=UPI003CE92700